LSEAICFKIIFRDSQSTFLIHSLWIWFILLVENVQILTCIFFHNITTSWLGLQIIYLFIVTEHRFFKKTYILMVSYFILSLYWNIIFNFISWSNLKNSIQMCTYQSFFFYHDFKCIHIFIWPVHMSCRNLFKQLSSTKHYTENARLWATRNLH
jgi:hypothetical protein